MEILNEHDVKLEMQALGLDPALYDAVLTHSKTPLVALREAAKLLVDAPLHASRMNGAGRRLAVR